MRPNPAYESTDAEVVRALIREHPWAILISTTSSGPVASHVPVLLDEDSSELAVVTHLGRPDDELHDLGGRELLLIVQGHHGYISPSWYAGGASSRVPTWNYSVAHCHGVPRILSEECNLRELTRLVAHFERRVERPVWLDPLYGARVAHGTIGIHMEITRFLCKRKLSQNRDPRARRGVIAALRTPGPFQSAALARDMEQELSASERT
jgi:transcriptional regulator